MEILRLSARCVFSRIQGDLTLGIPPLDVPSSDARGWRAVVRVLRSPVDDLGSVLFPSPCRLCGDPLLRVSSIPVCVHCIARVHPQKNSLCLHCGESLGFESWRPADQQICEMCRLASPPFVRAVAYGVYHEEMRSMLHLLKYEGVRNLARPLGRMLASAIAALEAEAPLDLLVIAVPLFPARERQRGYNQTVLLADEALSLLQRKQPERRLQAAHSMLVRQRSTESQFNLSPSARRTNLRGAFSVPKPELIAGRDVLLVDDIYTTGATARECSRTLLRAGAKSVWIATLSRAQVETHTVWDEASFAASVHSRQATGVWKKEQFLGTTTHQED